MKQHENVDELGKELYSECEKCKGTGYLLTKDKIYDKRINCWKCNGKGYDYHKYINVTEWVQRKKNYKIR